LFLYEIITVFHLVVKTVETVLWNDTDDVIEIIRDDIKNNRDDV